MARIESGLCLLFGVVLGASISVTAQNSQIASPQGVKVAPVPPDIDQSAPGKLKEIPASRLSPQAPFDTETKYKSERSIRVVPEAEMTREDQDLLADAESSIQERTGVENLEFNREGWTYYKLDCPALPKHLFVRFTRDNGTRQMSMFSAAIPRDGNGRVHIIPIVRKGYSLFSPAPIGALTIAAFNRIRAEEGAGTSADWLGTGLCYAALAGANPNAGESIANDASEFPATIPPTLATLVKGGAIVSFVDVSATPHAMEWSLTFGSNGKLLKASHVPAVVVRAKSISETITATRAK